MKSKIGFHVDIQGHQGQVEKMIRAGVRIAKVITSMGMLRALHDALGDKTIYIARDWKVGDDFLRFIGDRSPKDAAKAWMDGMRPAMVQAPFAYWESFNEMSGWDHLRRYGEFEAERQRLMHAEGYKACIGNFAVGTPDISNTAEEAAGRDKWPDFYPALQVAHELGNILGLHEYGGLYMDMFYGPNQSDAVLSGRRVPFPDESYEGWLFGRYRKVWRRHIQPNGWTNIRIALTEFGLDAAAQSVTSKVAGYPVASWSSCAGAWSRLDNRTDAAQFYVEQLKWADRQMQKDPYVVGATIFTWGTISRDRWLEFDVEGPVAESLISYIQSTKDDGTTPSPNGDDVIKPSVFVTPIPADGLWLRRGPGSTHATITLLHPRDKLGALETEAQVMEKIGKDQQWLKVRTADDKEGYVAAWLVEQYGTAPIDDRGEGEKVFVTPIFATGVALHSGAGTQYEQLEPIYMGDILEILDPSGFDDIGQNGEWLKVRTPRGRNGYVGAWLVQRTSYGVRREEPKPDDKPDEEPKEDKDPLFIHTNSAQGIFLRSGPGVEYDKVSSVFPRDKLQVIGSKEEARAKLGQRNQWIQVKDPLGNVGWGGGYFLELIPTVYRWPGGHSLVGLHGPADPGAWPWNEGAYEVVRKAKIKAVKLHAWGDIGGAVVERLRQLGVEFIMARLFGKFPTARTPQNFVEEVGPAMVRLYNSGVRYFEVHNEPNLHNADSPEGMWVAWQNGREFGQWFENTVKILRTLAPGAQFGWPGLSPGPDAPEGRANSDVFLQQADAFVRRADFVCMHTYWGGDTTPYTNSINQVRDFCNRYPNQLIFVTEFANSSRNVGKDVKGREYAMFYTEAQKLPSNLGGLFSYALSASSGYPEQMWINSPIPDLVAGRAVPA